MEKKKISYFPAFLTIRAYQAVHTPLACDPELGEQEFLPAVHESPNWQNMLDFNQ
jgi:hypothetical protein